MLDSNSGGILPSEVVGPLIIKPSAQVSRAFLVSTVVNTARQGLSAADRVYRSVRVVRRGTCRDSGHRRRH
jgi:hypothetical protein